MTKDICLLWFYPINSKSVFCTTLQHWSSSKWVELCIMYSVQESGYSCTVEYSTLRLHALILCSVPVGFVEMEKMCQYPCEPCHKPVQNAIWTTPAHVMQQPPVGGNSRFLLA
ncbi:uncharacterized protein ACIGJ3_010720 isoform 1-T1 [Trichechus inunguis]